MGSLFESEATRKKASEVRDGKRERWREEHSCSSPCPLLPEVTFNASVFSYVVVPNIRGHWTVGTLLVITTSIKWVEGRDAGKHPIIHRTAPQEKELSGPTHQQCQG